jgi:hypothetical protein
MPKLNIEKVPKQCNDRGRSFSWHKGKRIYHGVAGTPEANTNYRRFVNNLTQEPSSPLPNVETSGGVNVGTNSGGGAVSVFHG